MKKVNLIKTSALMLLVATACNKSGITHPSSTENSAVQVKKVVEKTYNVPSEKIISVIKAITSHENYTTANAKGFIPDTLISPDSTVWLLEAALNYHFDKVPDDHDVYTEFVSFSAPFSYDASGVPTMAPSDFEDVYRQFKTEITTRSAGPQKVKVIDITAEYDFAANRINYTGEVVFYLGSNATNNCNPFGVINAKWSTMFWNTTSCGTGPSLDAPTLMNQKLNSCPKYNPGCNNWFYVNVSTAGWNGQTYPTQLFSASTPVPQFPCNVLSGGQLNTKIPGCKSLAVGAAPAGKLILNYNITSAYIGTATFNNGWWGMSVQYGNYACNNNPN